MTIQSMVIPKSYARDDAAEDRRNIPTVRACSHAASDRFQDRAKCSEASPASSVCGSFSKRPGPYTRCDVRQGWPRIPVRTRTRRRRDRDLATVLASLLTAERIAKAKKLKLAITAGIGSDHVDLQAAIDRNITVAEVTYCNSISVSEHVVMTILALVRNYIPSYNGSSRAAGISPTVFLAHTILRA